MARIAFVETRGGNNPTGTQFATPADCGTYAGYQKHRKQQEAVCADCREANAVYAHHLRRRHVVAGINATLRRRPELAEMAQPGVRFVVGAGESA